MRKNTFLFLTLIGLISCTNDVIDNTSNESQNQSGNFNFIYTVLLKDNNNDSVYRQAYLIENGKVITEKYTNYNHSEYNHLSTFEYNSNGRVVKEIRDNQIFTEISWDNNIAKVFNKNKELIGEFQFNNSMQLISYNDGIKTRFLNHDSNGNVTSIGTAAGIYVEYLDYDTSKNCPFNLINSIAVLRIDYKPNFKNVFKTEEAYPYEDDDYSMPLTFYKYSWTLNSNGLIESMTDEKTLIYISKFEYK
jgi:hypothetical protein